MNRISSTAVTVALAATLLVAAAPAAQARNIAKPRPAAVVTSGWVEVALNWLGGFFVGAPQGQATRSMEKTTTYPTPIPLPGGGYKPMTGACIDPNGCVFGSGN